MSTTPRMVERNPGAKDAAESTLGSESERGNGLIEMVAQHTPVTETQARAITRNYGATSPCDKLDSRWQLRPDTPFRYDTHGNLVFYNFDRAIPDRWVSKGAELYALFFFIHFPVVWGLSFAYPILMVWLAYTRRLLWFTAGICFLLYVYLPIPKRRRNWQLFHFHTICQYYKKGSYRITNPTGWPELKPILERLDQEKAGNPLPIQRWTFNNLVDEVTAIKTPRPRIWLCHPHGFTGNGWGQHAFNPYFPEVHHCVANVLYYLAAPIICYTSHLGNPTPVTKRAIKRLLSNGESMTLILGGFEEATITPTKGDRLWFKRRNGIFKYAIEYEAELVPYFTFGESQMFSNIQGMWKLRLWLSRNSIPAIIPWGRFFHVPRNEMMHIVIGKKVLVSKTDTLETVKRNYLQAVEELYAQYAPIFYNQVPPPQLEIW